MATQAALNLGHQINQFIAMVEKYLDEWQLETLTGAALAGIVNNSKSDGIAVPKEVERIGQKVVDHQHKKHGHRNEITALGWPLVAAMEAAQINAAMLSELLSLADRGGGGAEAVNRAWPKTRGELKRATLANPAPAEKPKRIPIADAMKRAGTATKQTITRAADANYDSSDNTVDAAWLEQWITKRANDGRSRPEKNGKSKSRRTYRCPDCNETQAVAGPCKSRKCAGLGDIPLVNLVR